MFAHASGKRRVRGGISRCARCPRRPEQPARRLAAPGWPGGVDILQWTGAGLTRIVPSGIAYDRLEIEDMPGSTDRTANANWRCGCRIREQSYRIEAYRWEADAKDWCRRSTHIRTISAKSPISTSRWPTSSPRFRCTRQRAGRSAAGDERRPAGRRARGRPRLNADRQNRAIVTNGGKAMDHLPTKNREALMQGSPGFTLSRRCGPSRYTGLRLPTAGTRSRPKPLRRLPLRARRAGCRAVREHP